MVNRAQRMAGRAVRFIPGWDCHGLPIEWRIEEEYRRSGRDKDQVPVLQFRAECRAYAAKWLAVQADEFARLGIQADWDHRYATMDFGSEAVIAAEIGKFLLNGSLYRGLRPVMWSPVERTALAEAEIEYHDHLSTTIWVAFPVIHDPTPGAALDEVSVVIWTTTPWTVPANRAIAYGPAITYAVIRVDETAPNAAVAPGARLLVAEALIEPFAATAGITRHHVLYTLPGEALEGAVCAHPLRGVPLPSGDGGGHADPGTGYDHDVPMLPGGFVSTDAGTGLVHMAPAHGEDDFTLCTAHGIPVLETVEGDGRYAPWVPGFAGIHVFKAADPVCAALAAALVRSHDRGGAPAGLLARGTLTHSYPHSWRSRAPVIFRATPQWFIRMDEPDVPGGGIRARALRALDDVAFIPAQSRNRLSSMVASRPDWCISRQRAWGVPIAVFVEKRTGAVLRDPAVMERVVDAFRAEGADSWYSSPPSRFLGPDRDPDAFEQVFDIVDVWFESGSTHNFVLGEAAGEGKLPYPADLYLEGSDQHRGWFQSSLLEAVGARNSAPFRAIVTNGFVLDEQGRKMSKSLGNVTAPQQVNDTLGADILRLWVMNSDTDEDLRIGAEILKQQGELYRKLRNTLRWLLGALDGFTPAERVPEAAMPELERWVLHRLFELDAVVRAAIDSHRWTGVYPAIHNFCATDLSAFYFDVRKDSLYCDAPNAERRRAARTVLDHLHRCLCAWLAPVLVFTAEDAWCARFGEDGPSVHEQLLPAIPASWRNDALAERWVRLRAVRRLVTAAIETARQSGTVASSLQAAVLLPASANDAALLEGVDWAELAIVSRATVAVDPANVDLFAATLPGGAPTGTFQPVPVVTVAPGAKCARCWRVLEEVGTHPHHPALCLRCADAVGDRADAA